MLLPAREVLGVVRLVDRGTRRIGEATRQLAVSSLEAALAALLRSRLVDILAADLVRYGVIQRVADPLLRDGVADALAERVASGPELERIVVAASDTPAARRLVAHVIESGVVDEAVTRLLESEELWILVDEVARSPSVTAAISHQSAGLADQVAEVVRDRSRNADARLERVARRVLRRNPRAPANGALPGGEA